MINIRIDMKDLRFRPDDKLLPETERLGKLEARNNGCMHDAMIETHLDRF
jgi:hypothetical protein